MDPWDTPFVREQTRRIVRGLKHWTGRDLLPGGIASAAFAQQVYTPRLCWSPTAWKRTRC